MRPITKQQAMEEPVRAVERYERACQDRPTGNRRPVRTSRGERYESLSDAAQEHGITPAAVCMAVKRKSLCRGRRWFYIEQEQPC